MAARYWVGGTDNWNGTAGTKWALTSGGAGGQAAPTSADDVFFDANSGANTVTIAASVQAKTVTCTGFTGTLAGTSTLTIYGNMTLVAGMTVTYSGTLSIGATATLISAGKTLGGLQVTNSSLTLTLGDALTLSGTLDVFRSTFDTANFNVTAASLLSNSGNTRAITLGSSTVTLTSTTPLTLTSGLLTFTAGTSQITMTVTPATFAGGGLTFNNVTNNANSGSGVATGDVIITGANTFANLTISVTSNPLKSLALAANQTVTGTLTVAGAAANNRIAIYSDTIGTSRTITAAAVSANDCDFRDITIAGAAAPISPTRAGDCKGNSGITFPAAKTVYWNLSGTQNWNSTGWATSSGGSPAVNNFPLAQDTAIFDNTGSAGTVTFNASWNVGTFNSSSRTNAMTLTFTRGPNIYSDWTSGTGVTTTGTQTVSFLGRVTQTVTSNGVTFTPAVVVQSPSGTVTLADNWTTSNTFTLTEGTLNTNSSTLTCTTFAASNTNTRTLAFGTGNITVNSTGTVWNTGTVTNLTVTGTPIVNVTNATATATTVLSGALSEANSISYKFTAGTYTLTFLGTASHTARNVDFTGFAGTWAATNAGTIYGDLKLSTGMTLTASSSVMTIGATSGTKTITSNGKTMDFPVTINGAGGTFQLADNLTLGSTRTFTHTNGTLDLNGKTLTVGTRYTTAAGTKNLTFNGGTVVCPNANTTSWNNAAPTNFTTTAGTGTGKISMTAATAKTFVGGGSTYNCTLSNDGAGALTISGSNTFTTLANGVQPTTFTFTSGTTQTLTNWSVSGTSGNLVTIGATTTSAATVSKSSGTVSADYLSISYSTATGGASWYAGANSTNGGNNTGWIFTAPPVSGNGRFLIFFH